ncbi:MAG: DNA methyltransferase, partial [Bacteroidales bacterium]
LPLRKSPNILCANALQTNWQQLIQPLPWDRTEARFDYIFGNPPFIGSKMMTDIQRSEIAQLSLNRKGNGVLDYVSGWYLKAAAYCEANEPEGSETNLGNKMTYCAYVSTNSICQGEQVSILWDQLYSRFQIKINFAHNTFKWGNEARGNAAVHVVIIGFSNAEIKDKRIYNYENITGEPLEVHVNNISPYLFEGNNLVISSRSKPLCDVPEIGIGNKPIDGGFYLFTEKEKDVFISEEPRAGKWFRQWIGSDELINNYRRWCLWVGECPPDELKSMPNVIKRVKSVQSFRQSSKSEGTRKLAETPTRFHVENMPKSRYLAIPEVSSERRKYIPIGYVDPIVLSSNLLKITEYATLFHFGI